MTKLFAGCLLFLCTALAACAQENPAPTTSPLPVPANLPGVPDARTPLPADATPVEEKFVPGAANTYSSVYVKGPYLAMTFDDGPSPDYTMTLLDELKKRKIRATFFLVGQNVAEFPQIVRRIVEEGHEVANHSWSHPAFAKMSDAAVTSQVERTQEAIKAACGIVPTLLRPPYGSVTKNQKSWINTTLKLKVILWSVDPLDWKKPGESVVRSRIVNGAESGAIILAHDIHGSTVRAMPATLDQLQAKGFQFVTVSELLAMEEPKPIPTAIPIKPSPEPTAAALPPMEATPTVGMPPAGSPLPTPVPLPP